MDHFRRGYSTAVWNEAVTLIAPYSYRRDNQPKSARV